MILFVTFLRGGVDRKSQFQVNQIRSFTFLIDKNIWAQIYHRKRSWTMDGQDSQVPQGEAGEEAIQVEETTCFSPWSHQSWLALV